jgi:hypothetical protein
LLEGSFDTDTRKEQLDMASKDGKHQATSILEAVACNIASMKTTGKGLWGMYNDRIPFLTCCREEAFGGEKLSDARRFVIGCSPSGFHVYDSDSGHDHVGVVRLLREF